VQELFAELTHTSGFTKSKATDAFTKSKATDAFTKSKATDAFTTATASPSGKAKHKALGAGKSNAPAPSSGGNQHCEWEGHCIGRATSFQELQARMANMTLSGAPCQN
jgi:hypothetical protein